MTAGTFKKKKKKVNYFGSSRHHQPFKRWRPSHSHGLLICHSTCSPNTLVSSLPPSRCGRVFPQPLWPRGHLPGPGQRLQVHLSLPVERQDLPHRSVSPLSQHPAPPLSYGRHYLAKLQSLTLHLGHLVWTLSYDHWALIHPLSIFFFFFTSYIPQTPCNSSTISPLSQKQLSTLISYKPPPSISQQQPSPSLFHYHLYILLPLREYWSLCPLRSW